jgi:hypothetical protein
MSLDKLRPDYYALELSVGGDVILRRYINVEPYVKPAYDLTITTDKTAFFTDDVAEVTIEAKFFDGTPVPNLDLVYTSSSGERNVKTDSAGQVRLNYQLAYSPCTENYSCWPRHESLDVRPAKSELGEIAASTSVRIYGPKVYAQSETDYPERGVAEAKFSFFRIDPALMEQGEWWSSDGLGKQPAPGTKLKVEVVKHIWDRIETGTSYDFINKRSYKTYHYEMRTENVETLLTQADAQGQYVYRRSVDADTEYEVRVRYADENGRENIMTAYLYYFDGLMSREVRWWGDDYHLQVPADKKYEVGEQVSVRFMRNDELLPSGAGNGYLFLQLQNGLQEVSVGDSSTYGFPFEERDVPNVHVYGVWFNGHTFVEATLGSWYAPGVMAELKSRTLKIDVTADKASYAPGDKAAVSVEVRGAGPSGIGVGQLEPD